MHSFNRDPQYEMCPKQRFINQSLLAEFNITFEKCSELPCFMVLIIHKVYQVIQRKF
jgi:hypothetical protein